MQEGTYRSASGVRVFQQAFLDDVVVGDDAYYEPMATLLERANVSPEDFVLSDLCRASFVRFDPKNEGDEGSTNSKESVLIKNGLLFMRYCEANREWHDARLRDGGFEVVVALGDLAAKGVAAWLETSGWRSDRMAEPPGSWIKPSSPAWATLTYRSPGGRIVHVLRAPHPSNRQSRAPADAADSLRALLRGDLAPAVVNMAARHIVTREKVRRGPRPPANMAYPLLRPTVAPPEVLPSTVRGATTTPRCTALYDLPIILSKRTQIRFDIEVERLLLQHLEICGYVLVIAPTRADGPYKPGVYVFSRKTAIEEIADIRRRSALFEKNGWNQSRPPTKLRHWFHPLSVLDSPERLAVLLDARAELPISS